MVFGGIASILEAIFDFLREDEENTAQELGFASVADMKENALAAVSFVNRTLRPVWQPVLDWESSRPDTQPGARKLGDEKYFTKLFARLDNMKHIQSSDVEKRTDARDSIWDIAPNRITNSRDNSRLQRWIECMEGKVNNAQTPPLERQDALNNLGQYARKYVRPVVEHPVHQGHNVNLNFVLASPYYLSAPSILKDVIVPLDPNTLIEKLNETGYCAPLQEVPSIFMGPQGPTFAYALASYGGKWYRLLKAITSRTPFNHEGGDHGQWFVWNCNNNAADEKELWNDFLTWAENYVPPSPFDMAMEGINGTIGTGAHKIASTVEGFFMSDKVASTGNQAIEWWDSLWEDDNNKKKSDPLWYNKVVENRVNVEKMPQTTREQYMAEAARCSQARTNWTHSHSGPVTEAAFYAQFCDPDVYGQTNKTCKHHLGTLCDVPGGPWNKYFE
jgi:hypothetical protein